MNRRDFLSPTAAALATVATSAAAATAATASIPTQAWTIGATCAFEDAPGAFEFAAMSGHAGNVLSTHA
jgi:hypothetical protein